MTIMERDRIIVCRHCLREDHPDKDIQHAQTFGVYCGDDSWDAEIVCTWPCGHGVADRWEPRCLYCQPLTDDEQAPF